MSLRFTSSLILASAFALLQPLATQAQSSIIGRAEGDQYFSPTTAFNVTIPVIAELGGTITDTDNVVSFQDEFTTHQSIACFKMDATLNREEETRGRKDYLIWFFANFVQADFEQRFAGARIESAHFIKSINDGALLTYNLLPGGTMFPARACILNNNNSIIAKRGNLLFVKNGYVFVVSIELVEKAVEHAAFTMTVAEEDAELRKRLLTFSDKITFTMPPAASTPLKPAAGSAK